MAKKIKRGDKIASSRSRKGNEEEDFIKDLLGRAVEKLGKDSKINKEISKGSKNTGRQPNPSNGMPSPPYAGLRKRKSENQPKS